MKFQSTPIRFLLYPSLGEVREHVRAELFGQALSARLGRPVLVEVAPTYEYVEQELREGRVDVAWATADQCDAFEPHARAVLRALRGGRWYYHAAFICRADSPLDLNRLQGTRAAWVAPMSVGGYVLATRHLKELGRPPETLFSEQRFVGSYRKALLAVLEGEADVASIFTSHADEHTVRALLAERVGSGERRLLPFAFTGPANADGVIITNRLPEEDAAQLESLLLSINRCGTGQEVLTSPFGIEGFVRVSGAERQPPAPRTKAGPEYLMVELDAEARCRRLWSPTGNAFGRSVLGGEGRLLSEVVGAEAAAPLAALARATQHRRMGGRVEYRLDVQGEPRWYTAEATDSGAREEGGEPCATLLVRDITEVRALEDSMYRLASFPQLHPDPLLELDLDGQLRYANPAAHTAFPDLLIRGVEHPLVDAARRCAQSTAAGEMPRSVQLSGRYWELTVAALPDAGGLRVFARDVTMRKEMETRLIQSDRLAALGSMAAAVGHEMNNPLAFMISNLAFVTEELERMRVDLNTRAEADLSALDEVMAALSETTEGAERMKNIVQDLRMLSREPSPYRSRVEVHPVLEDSLKLVRNELRHRTRLEKELHPVPLVEADEARLGQVFLNLLLNAAQAMSEEDVARNVLRVSTRTGPRGEALIEIQDTGPGMPPEVLARIFEPFYSTHPTAAGLGLSVSHAIVTGLGGTLRAESREGEGTTFIVSLPPAPPQSSLTPGVEHSLSTERATPRLPRDIV